MAEGSQGSGFRVSTFGVERFRAAKRILRDGSLALSDFPACRLR